MKKALSLILVAAVVVAGFFSVRGEMPFMPVFGGSMEPTLQSGNLILIEKTSPSDIKVGDIVVYKVPAAIRDYYGYPPIVAHRVIKINTERGITFRTKGDNTGEDPFTVRAQDLKGKISQQIPYVGLPLLFLQSEQGLIFVVVALSLFALYLFADELSRGRRRATAGLFAPVIEGNQHGFRVLAQRIDGSEKRMGDTQQALNNFASAIEVYAEHLKSHTGAIQGLSEASHELKKGAATQNEVLSRLMTTMDRVPARTEPVPPRALPVPPRAAPVTPKAEPATPEPEAEEVTPEPERVQYVTSHIPGCVRNRQHPTKQGPILRAG